MAKKIIFMAVLLTAITVYTFKAEAQDTAGMEKIIIEIKINDNAINVNGAKKEIDRNKNVKTILNEENGHILVPLRCVAESLGYRVGWNETNKNVILIKDETLLQFDVNKNNSVLKLYRYNKLHTGYLDFYYVDIMHDRTYVSLNFIADILNCEIGWNNENSSITVTGKDGTVETAYFKGKQGKLNRKYIDEQLKKTKETKEKIIYTMKNADANWKMAGSVVIFIDDYYNFIFMNIYGDYFSNCRSINQSEYTGILSMDFDTIEEAEEAVTYLNNWDTVNYAELGYIARLCPV